MPAHRLNIVALSTLSLIVGGSAMAAKDAPINAERQPPSSQKGAEQVAPYHARFGRARPVIAIIGLNGGTELTDYVIPYGILSRANVGEIVPIATEAGPITMRPALRLQPMGSMADFDALYPEGADYVIVPAVTGPTNPALLGWIRRQAAKGGTLLSICDGALVLAASGVMNGHRATAHWGTAGYRRKHYPKVRWEDDRRYVADGTIVSSAGISAAVPVSLALIEAIAGHDRAVATASEIGVSTWGPDHDSHRFHPKFGRNLSAFATTIYLNPWLHKRQDLGLPMSNGVDEVALAFAADAYARTGRARTYTVSAALKPVTTLHGLTVLPDRVDAGSFTRVVPVPAASPGSVMDDVLASIARAYGKQTAYGVALDFEYPGFHD